MDGWNNIFDPKSIFLGIWQSSLMILVSLPYIDEFTHNLLITGHAGTAGSRRELTMTESRIPPNIDVIELFMGKSPNEEAASNVQTQIDRLIASTNPFLKQPDTKITAWLALKCELQINSDVHPSITIAKWEKQYGKDLETSRTAIPFFASNDTRSLSTLS